VTITPITSDMTSDMRASVEAKIAEYRADAAHAFAIADALDGYAEDHRRQGALAQARVNDLTHRLEVLS
jgi:hypothetical protein